MAFKIHDFRSFLLFHFNYINSFQVFQELSKIPDGLISEENFIQFRCYLISTYYTLDFQCSHFQNSSYANDIPIYYRCAAAAILLFFELGMMKF